MSKVLDNILYDGQAQRLNNVCLKCISINVGSSDFDIYRCIVHIMSRVLGKIPCAKIKVKDHKMYFLVNAYPPLPLDVTTSNFAGA